jgi:D-ribose pyranose/furanose isomerase RbsD
LFCFLDTSFSTAPLSESDNSQQVSNSGIDVAGNMKEIKQEVVVGETGRAVETHGSQQLTAVAEQTCVNKTEAVEKAKLQAEGGNELNVSDAGHTVSGSAERISSHVVVVANKIEQIKHVVVQERTVAETLAESMQKFPASPEKTIADNQNSIGKGIEGSETGSMDVDSTVQVPSKGLIPSKSDSPRHAADLSGVSQSESSAQISNNGSDVASNITEVKEQVLVGETEKVVGETIGQGYQQLSAVSKETFANKNKTAEEATSQAGNGNEMIVSDARHTISGGPGQISDNVIFVANEFGEIKQVVVQEMATTDILIKSGQQSSSAQEKTSVDDQNIEEGKKNTREIPTFQELNEVVDTFDEFVEDFLMTGTKSSDKQREQELVLQSEKKKIDEKGEKKGVNAELKIESDGSSNNTDISDASGKRSSEKVEDDLRAKTPEKDEKDSTQGNPEGNSSKKVDGAKGDEASKKGDAASKKGGEASKKGNEASKKGDETSKKGGEASKKSGEASKKVDKASKKSDETSKKGDEANKKGGEASKKVDKASKKGDEASKKGDEDRSQKTNILNKKGENDKNQSGHGRTTRSSADSKHKTTIAQESKNIQVCFSIAVIYMKA